MGASPHNPLIKQEVTKMSENEQIDSDVLADAEFPDDPIMVSCMLVTTFENVRWMHTYGCNTVYLLRECNINPLGTWEVVSCDAE